MMGRFRAHVVDGDMVVMMMMMMIMMKMMMMIMMKMMMMIMSLWTTTIERSIG